MSDKKFTFWCESCSKKYFFENKDDLYKIERSMVQKKIPHIDLENNKKTNSIFVERKNHVKCMHCGFLLKDITIEKK